MRSWLVIPLLCACSSSQSGDSLEEEFVQKSVTELQTALAARDESGVTINCMVVAGAKTRAHLSSALREKVEGLCFRDAPRLILENGLHAVQAANAQSSDPALKDLNCFQLLVPDAIMTLVRHPSSDAALNKLVADYRALCPNDVAKAERDAKTKPEP